MSQQAVIFCFSDINAFSHTNFRRYFCVASSRPTFEPYEVVSINVTSILGFFSNSLMSVLNLIHFFHLPNLLPNTQNRSTVGEQF